MKTQTFTFRQLEADPTLCASMRRLWQDSEGKTVTFSVPDAKEPSGTVTVTAEEFAKGGAVALKSTDGKLEVVKASKPKAKGKKK